MILAGEDYLYTNMSNDSLDLTLKRPPLSLPFYYGWFVLSLCFLTTLTSAGGVGSVLTATVGNRWFVARRGLALGILGSASSTGQIIFLPLFMAMITYAGWRMGSMALIVVALILLPLIYLFMRDDPSEIGLEPYGAGQPGAASSGGVASLR